MNIKNISLFLCACCISIPVLADEKQVYFGDTHLHTANSFDAYLMFNRDAGPDTAYKWAKGLPVIHPFTRTRIQIGTPLDFLVVADHAEYLGVMEGIDNDTVQFDKIGLFDSIKRWIAKLWLENVLSEEKFDYDNFYSITPATSGESLENPVLEEANQTYITNAKLANAEVTNRNTWHEIIEAADKHNDPGNFTAFIGWEWSSVPGGSNLHRVIMTPDDGSIAKQYMPFSMLDSQYPEDLWKWLESTSNNIGANFLAIPHNSNASKGHMFDVKSLRGEPITNEYAQLRAKWEPVVEITQIKGDSETHPTLSPNDEFADFENFYLPVLHKDGKFEAKKGDFVRSALKTGLEIESSIGLNPYTFGVVGSTDSHTGLASVEEDNFWGKVAVDSIPQFKQNDLLGKGVNGWSMSASGIAAVWAEENTRESIFKAFQNREVYGTTGPFIKVKVLAKWSSEVSDEMVANLTSPKYSSSTPMGGRLSAETNNINNGDKPSFYIQALKDPKSASLDRLQIIKGWVDSSGKAKEKVFDLAWSGKRRKGKNGKVAPVQNTVNLETGKYDNSVGDNSFTVWWTDPDFSFDDSAFYYVRVLEIPTPRHSLLDAIALNMKHLDDKFPPTIQERAYTSAILYSPAKN